MPSGIGTVANDKFVKLENKDVYLGESFILMRKDNSRTRETSFFSIEVSNADGTVQLETDEAANDTGSSLTIIPRVMAELLGLLSHPRFVLSFSSANGAFLMYLAEAQVSVGKLPSKSIVMAIDEPGDAEESNCLVGIDVQKAFRLICDHEDLRCYPVGTPSAALKTEKEMLQYVPATKFRVKHEDLLPISSLPSIREKSEEDHLAMLAEGANDKCVLSSSDMYIPKGGWQPVRRKKVAA